MLVRTDVDMRRADHGYAYVGSSRVRAKADVFHVGKIRRTDWLPVGGDLRGEEQVEPGAASQPSDSDYDPTESSDDDDDDDSDSSSQQEHRWARFIAGADPVEADDGAAALFADDSEPSGSERDFARFLAPETPPSDDGAAALFRE